MTVNPYSWSDKFYGCWTLFCLCWRTRQISQLTAQVLDGWADINGSVNNVIRGESAWQPALVTVYQGYRDLVPSLFLWKPGNFFGPQQNPLYSVKITLYSYTNLQRATKVLRHSYPLGYLGHISPLIPSIFFLSPKTTLDLLSARLALFLYNTEKGERG